MTNSNTEPVDCRSEDGITAGLVDALISVARVLAARDLTTPAAVEALADLGTDEDMACVMKAASISTWARPFTC